jgi:hypothetical protein
MKCRRNKAALCIIQQTSLRPDEQMERAKELMNLKANSGNDSLFESNEHPILKSLMYRLAKTP